MRKWGILEFITSFKTVSKKIKTAGGMGMAVIFVITIASLLTSVVYNFVLIPCCM